MFDALTTKLSGIFSRLGSRGILKEKDIEDGLREIRLALLEAGRVASGCQGIYGLLSKKRPWAKRLSKLSARISSL